MDKYLILKIFLIFVIISGSGYLVYSFVAPPLDIPEQKGIEENIESTNECGEKPEFHEFLGMTSEEITLYDPSEEELDAFNTLLEKWNNCVNTLDWQTYTNEELGYSFLYPKKWGAARIIPQDTKTDDTSFVGADLDIQFNEHRLRIFEPGSTPRVVRSIVGARYCDRVDGGWVAIQGYGREERDPTRDADCTPEIYELGDYSIEQINSSALGIHVQSHTVKLGDKHAVLTGSYRHAEEGYSQSEIDSYFRDLVEDLEMFVGRNPDVSY